MILVQSGLLTDKSKQLRIASENIIKEEFDENKIVKEMIQLEKDRQYQNFSQIYLLNQKRKVLN